ncbi:hypothetical protein FVR03_13760, partial [Pontibacter qinzhouensis]
MLNSLRLRFQLPSVWWLLGLILLLFSTSAAQATHIRAGDITAKRDTTPNPNPRRFFFTMVIYRDTSPGSAEMESEPEIFDGLVFRKVRVASVVPIGNDTEKHTFRWETTFPADGTYTASWTGINRNNNILNLSAPSDQHSFYIQTTININSLRGFNSTPVLTVDPIDLGMVGRKFVHNPGAFDADGDSLAFKFVTPRRRDPMGNIITVPGFQMPHLLFGCQNSLGTGPATFTLDPLTGQLEWDAPCRRGEYNIAFVVEEWRVSPGGGAVKLGE